jgi:NADH-quinone oxidoreductase subunit N
MLEELLLIYPELTLIFAICAVLVADMTLAKRLPAINYYVSFVFLLYIGYCLAHRTPVNVHENIFNGAINVTSYSQIMKFIATILMLAITVQSKLYLGYIKKAGCEFYVLCLINLLGIFVMVSAGNFLVLYLGLELVALTLYTLVAFDREAPQSSEAAMKFYVLGAVASGFLLYGISLIYGATGSINFAEVSLFYGSGSPPQLLSIVGLMFILVSVIFKFGAFPMFQWVPDTYEGSMLPVGMILSSISKVASFIFFVILLRNIFEALDFYWMSTMFVVGLSSLIYGNVVALRQTNIKRLVAYSTIGHVGFILIALSLYGDSGFSSALFYTVTYALMAFALFAILIALYIQGIKVNSINDLKGLHASQPILAMMMLLTIFSMAGIPPFIGFHAKLFVLQALLEADYLMVAITCVLMSLIAAYYYLKIIWFIYFESCKHYVKPKRNAANILAITSSVGLLLIGVFPAAWTQFLFSINP